MTERSDLFEQIRNFKPPSSQVTLRLTSINLQRAYETQKNVDFKFKFKNSKNVLYVHKVIITSCTTFDAMLNVDMREMQDNECEIDDSEAGDDELLFTEMVKTLYGFTIQIPSERILELLIMTDKYGHEALFSQTIEELQKMLLTCDIRFMLDIIGSGLTSKTKMLKVNETIKTRLQSSTHSPEVKEYCLAMEASDFLAFNIEYLSELPNSLKTKVIWAWMQHDLSKRQHDGMIMLSSIYGQLETDCWPSEEPAPPPQPVKKKAASLFDDDDDDIFAPRPARVTNMFGDDSEDVTPAFRSPRHVTSLFGEDD
jgi:hypothetical protein